MPMAIQKNNRPETAWNDLPKQAQEETQIRIRVKIPKQYHQEPVISRLVSHHGLTVNIKAAILGAQVPGDGWFDLELQGSAEQIQSGLAYVQELDLEIWHDNPSEPGDW
jgi:ABC-type methionine transport system ATPase subunit